MEYYLASLYPCEVCGTVFGFICSGLSKIISAWRQQKWLEWFFLWDPLRNAHGCTCTIKHRLIIKEPTFLHSTNEIHRSCEKAAPKCDISVLCQLSLLTPTPPNHHHHPHPSPGPPSAGRMSLEVASDVSSSTGQRASAVGPWWMWLVWETIRCVWSTRHRLGRPAQTHQMTHKQPAGLFACLLHTPTNKRHTWRWVICAATGPG